MSSLRSRLLAGGARSYGPMLMSNSPVVAEMLSGLGYGHLIIDHEHAVTDIQSGQVMLQAIRSGAMTTAGASCTEPIIRVPSDDPAYIKKALDTLRLPGGILVPMVEDAGQAARVVDSCRYPRLSPATATMHGSRGCAFPFVRASGWGIEGDYPQRCDGSSGELLIMVQVESAAAVEQIPQIAKVPGVDAVFLGPFDLSCSLGRMGRFDDPDVARLIRRAEEEVVAAGVVLAGFRSPGRELQEMWDRGYSLVCGGVDLGLLREAAKADVASAAAWTK